MTFKNKKIIIAQANELIKVNKELDLQNSEKEKRASEMLLANQELLYQNQEKEKRASELLRANEELAFQNQEKEKRAAELILINKALFQQKSQLEDFCNIISHNLRAPLVNISMLVDFITETDDEQDQQELKEKLRIATYSLNEIFNELIESLQVKQDLDVASDNLSLKEYLDTACSGLQGQIRESHAVMEIDFNEILFVRYPPQYLKSIFHNLISNALKYQFPGRQLVIRVKVRRVKNSIILSIEDNGLGIDLARHKNNLFKIRKVFHVHPEAKGFGLFITKAQVEAMGGKIWVESVVNSGSTFFVEFINQYDERS